MQLGRFQVSTLRPPPILSIDFSVDGRFFGVATENGYEVWRSWPLALVRRRKLPGTLARALPLPDSPLVALQGGGTTPLYPPNKVVIFHDGIGRAIAELEFGERVRGLVARRGAVLVALTRRVVVFEYGVARAPTSGKGKGAAIIDETSFRVSKIGEWETVTNETGLMAVSTLPGTTLLAIPGRQPGHVQLIHLPPCPPNKPNRPAKVAHRSPIIIAHTHPLSSLACTASGSHIITTSERGTLLRVWDTSKGRLERELRRGVDRAEMWGAVLEEGIFPAPSEGVAGGSAGHGGRVVGWSDKGTVHLWGDEEAPADGAKAGTSHPTSLARILSQNLPLPKYFSSSPSTALYHLPRKNPHAFASAIGAAAEKARMPSMKMSSAEQDGEWSERFVVGWVEVDVVVPEDTSRVSTNESRRSSDVAGATRMGTREERRSFGSDATGTATATGTITGTPRTATPTMGRQDTGSLRPPRLMGAGQGDRPASRQERSFSASSRATVKPRRVTLAGAPPEEKRAGGTVKERQLVAITYGGDWYRLRIPHASVGGVEDDRDGDREKKPSRRLELVEYRRLNVGGGGW